MIHLLERGVLRPAAFGGERRLDAVKAPHELGVGVTQSGFRINAEMARDIGHDEEEIAVFLEDAGKAPKLSAVGVIPNYAGNEYPATFGQSADEAGNVYVQWHRRDNAGRVEILKLGADGKVQADFVKGTETAIELPGLLSFASVAVRNGDVYRVKPENGLGLCRHRPGEKRPTPYVPPPTK